MKLRNLGKNANEVVTDNYQVLISYETPVASYNKRTGQFLRTSKKWSATTNRHISAWLGDNGGLELAEEAPQGFFGELLNQQGISRG